MLQKDDLQEVPYSLREVTIKATTREMWAIVDLIHEAIHDTELAIILSPNGEVAQEFRVRGLRWRELAGQIKRQLVDDINKEIDRQATDRTNVSRETLEAKRDWECI